jgi:thiamine-phosphate pyrophosphorylase
MRGAIAGGVSVVQIRERSLDGRDAVALVRDCLALARGTACRVIVNDRLDVALAAGASGVHLREDSVSIDAARRLATAGFVVGRSVHDAAAAAGARNADYLIVGNVFETESKPGREPLGLAGLRDVVTAASGCPVWAIGGITPDRVPEVIACGIEGVAAIGAFLPRAGATDITEHVRRQTEALRLALDESPTA